MLAPPASPWGSAVSWGAGGRLARGIQGCGVEGSWGPGEWETEQVRPQSVSPHHSCHLIYSSANLSHQPLTRAHTHPPARQSPPTPAYRM